MEPYKILVVEDEENEREAIRRSLVGAGYDVDTAENGKVALRLWEERIYDLLLVDLKMPEMSGRELINRVKNQLPYIQIVILSGQSEKEDLIEALQLHVFSYLEKGVDLKDMLKVIDDALKERDPVLLALEKLVECEGDEPLLYVGEDTLSAHQIYNEVRKGTQFGKQYALEYKKSLIEIKETGESLDDLLGIKGVME